MSIGVATPHSFLKVRNLFGITLYILNKRTTSVMLAEVKSKDYPIDLNNMNQPCIETVHI